MKNSYFNRKEEYTRYAVEHTHEMSLKYEDAIAVSIENSRIYTMDDIISFPPEDIDKIDKLSTVEYWDKDTVTAILDASDSGARVWVLNFASYKNPGGMFLQGSSAQEECLCRESFLYNVIGNHKFKDYYEWNRKNLNKGLYKNRMIISPDIIFERPILYGDRCGRSSVIAYKNRMIISPDVISDPDIMSERPIFRYGRANVITCAAPNLSTAKYGKFTREEADEVMFNRIRFIQVVLRDLVQDGDVIILGAYGCGVFCNNPEDVGRWFSSGMYILEHNCRVIFAVPSRFKADAEGILKGISSFVNYKAPGIE